MKEREKELWEREMGGGKEETTFYILAGTSISMSTSVVAAELSADESAAALVAVAVAIVTGLSFRDCSNSLQPCSISRPRFDNKSAVSFAECSIPPAVASRCPTVARINRSYQQCAIPGIAWIIPLFIKSYMSIIFTIVVSSSSSSNSTYPELSNVLHDVLP